MRLKAKLDPKVASLYTDTNHVQTIRGAQITIVPVGLDLRNGKENEAHRSIENTSSTSANFDGRSRGGDHNPDAQCSC